jgi:hypothetical protein
MHEGVDVGAGAGEFEAKSVITPSLKPMMSSETTSEWEAAWVLAMNISNSCHLIFGRDSILRE